MVLSDADVQKQIKQMMAFIEQEANEKAEEIDAKAEEEFNIEKGRLVQQQRLKIMEFFEKKEKQVELQKKIQSSNMLNQARLKVLKAREEHVRSVLDESSRRIGQITHDVQKYKEVLRMLIAQGLTQLMEKNVEIQCKQADLALVNEVLSAAVGDYKRLANKEVTVTVDTKQFLPAELSGGVQLSSRVGKIKVANTFEARLELISHQMVPEIRAALFGKNPNRKHLD